MPEDRQRVVYKEWVRDPKGKLLEKPPPRGTRTENNIIWGHTLDDFYWIPRIPGVNVLTIWSGSMIKEYGENYLKEKLEEEPEPRRLRPWPCLTLPDHVASSAGLGYIDEGCGRRHERPLQRIEDEVVKKPKVAKAKPICGSEKAVETAAKSVDASPPPDANASATVTSSGAGAIVTACAAPVADSPPVAPASASSTAQDVAPIPNGVVATAESTANPEQTTAPTQVDTDPAAAAPANDVALPSDAGSPAPGSAVLVSPADDSLKTASWTSDGPEWTEAKVMVPPVRGVASADTPCVVEPGSEAPAHTIAAQDPKADVMDPDVDAHAPKVEDDVGEGDKAGEETSDPPTTPAGDAMVVDAPKLDKLADVVDAACGVDASPGASTAETQDSAAEAMEADSPKVDDGAADSDKLGDGDAVGGAEVKGCTEKPCGDAGVQVLADVQAVPSAASEIAPVSRSLVSHPDRNDGGKAATGEAKATAEPSAATQDAKPDTANEPANPVSTPAPLEPPTPVKASPPPPPPTPEPVFGKLPKLEEFIPEEYFPDILYVNDPDESTTHTYYYSARSAPATGQSQEPVPRKYKRVWPRFARDTELATALNTDYECASIKLPTPPASSIAPPPPSPPPATCDSRPVVPGPETNLRIAHLNLSSAPRLGVGNHSVVHRAALRLPVPLSARSPTGEVTVAAKTGFSNEEARRLLLNEGKIYGAFPKHLQEDWCGMNLVAPITHPVPVHAVVPKFYGYYVPVREDVEREKQEAVRAWKEKRKQERQKQKKEWKATARELRKAAKTDRAPSENKSQGDASTGAATADPPTKIEEEDDEEVAEVEHDEDEDEDAARTDEKDALCAFKRSASYHAWNKVSPILLLEECGSPILPQKFTADDRSECYSLALRLHYAEFTQGSFYIRNILRQPGPLTVAPSARSDRTPSFRIIDFGRGEHWPYLLEAAKKENEERRRLRAKSKAELMKVPTEEQMKERVAVEEREDLADKNALEQCGKSWWESRDYEVRKAHSELQIRDFNY